MSGASSAALTRGDAGSRPSPRRRPVRGRERRAPPRARARPAPPRRRAGVVLGGHPLLLSRPASGAAMGARQPRDGARVPVRRARDGRPHRGDGALRSRDDAAPSARAAGRDATILSRKPVWWLASPPSRPGPRAALPARPPHPLRANHRESPASTRSTPLTLPAPFLAPQASPVPILAATRDARRAWVSRNPRRSPRRRRPRRRRDLAASPRPRATRSPSSPPRRGA